MVKQKHVILAVIAHIYSAFNWWFYLFSSCCAAAADYCCVCVCVWEREEGVGGRKHSDSQYSPHSPNVEVRSKGLKKIPAFMQEYIGLDFPSYKKCDSFLISTQF